MIGFNLIVAHDSRLGIGKNGNLPWKLPEDLKNFKKLTSFKDPEGREPAIIMGSKTWESLPFRPLPGRTNVIISNTYKYIKGAEIFTGLGTAIITLCARECYSDVFVIGGAGIYAEAITNPLLKSLMVTEVQGDFECDRFFPEYDKHSWDIIETGNWLPSEVTGTNYRFITYTRRHYA